MTLKVIIPVNRLDRAKGRRSDVLSATERRELTLATLGTVATAVLEAGFRGLLLTAEEGIGRHVKGLQVLPERPGHPGLNAQLEIAVQDMGEVLILHGDLPLATGPQLIQLVAEAPEAPCVVMVRSRDGGTNAMLLRPAGRFPLQYGNGSFARHEEAARGAGMTVVRHRDALLALDLDTADDLLLLLTMDPHDSSAAARYLRPLDLASRMAGRSGRSPSIPG